MILLIFLFIFLTLINIDFLPMIEFNTDFLQYNEKGVCQLENCIVVKVKTDQ